MVAFPGNKPVIKPVVAFTVATDGAELVQEPPLRPSEVKVVVAPPAHKVAEPLIVPALASGFTVITFVAPKVPHPFVTV